MKPIPRKKYTEGFKREAVRLVEEGLSLAVSRRLDVPNQSIGNWLRRSPRDGTPPKPCAARTAAHLWTSLALRCRRGKK